MSSSVEQMIQQEAARVEIRTDKESSMLKGEERVAAGRAVERVIDHYSSVLEERGGVEGVYREIVAYLSGKIDDPKSVTDPAHRQGLDIYRTALRAILDPEVSEGGKRATGFENLLHFGVRSYSVGYASNESIQLRTLLAYYWLAATDPNMPISEAQLATVPGDSEQEKRNKLIEGDRENLIAKIAEIRRAHNGDVGYKGEDSAIDEPSCGPGTYGRIVSSIMSNSIAKLQANPVPGFPMDVEAFILNRFQKAGKDVRDGYEFWQNKYFVDVDYSATGKSEKEYQDYQVFIQRVVGAGAKAEFLTHLEQTYGKEAMTPERRGIAGKLYQEISSSLDFSIEGVTPKITLSDKIRNFIEKEKKKEILEKVTQDAREKYSKFYQEISSECSRLAQEFSSLDLAELSNEDLNGIISSFAARYNEIFARKEEGDKEILAGYRKLYEENLGKADLNVTLTEIARLNLLSLDKNGDKQKLDEARLALDAVQGLFMTRVKGERTERMKALFENFSKNSLEKFMSEARDLNAIIHADIASIEGVISDLDRNASVPDISRYSQKLSQTYDADIRKVYERAKADFCEELALNELELSLGEHDELDQNVGIKQALNLEQNVKTLEELNSKIAILNDKKLTHDKYQRLLRDAEMGSRQIALTLFNKTNDFIAKLSDPVPAKESREAKQLTELMLMSSQLRPYAEKGLGRETLDVSELIKKADALSSIIEGSKKKFEEIGYPGKMRRFVDAAKNKCGNLLNYLRGLKTKTKTSLKAQDVNEMVAYVNAFNVFKTKVKEESENAARPEYAKPKSAQ